jgi:hypothetical protein
MDPMDAELIGNYPMFRQHPRARDDHERTMAVAAERVRANLGRAVALVQQITLGDAAPCGAIASSGYCLGSAGGGYLIFMPASDYGWRGLWAGVRRGRLHERVTLDLSSARGRLGVEWLQVSSGERFAGDPVQAGGRVELSAPFRGDAVLLLRAASRPE